MSRRFPEHGGAPTKPSRRRALRGLAASAVAASPLARLASGCVACLAGAPAAAGTVAEAGRLTSRPARWYTQLPEDWVQCGLCPRGCKVPDGERGTCGVRENHHGRYYTLVHSRPCSIALDPIEKTPFFHFLPGTQALALATAGCNFTCKCCQNWEIAQARPEQVQSLQLAPQQVVEAARQRGSRVVACTYTEPVVFSEYVLDIAAAGRRAGVRTVVVSNGFIQEAPLADLCREVAAYRVDLKSFSEAFYKDYCGGELKPVLDTLRRLVAHGTWTEVVVLLIPTLNDSVSEIRTLSRFVHDELGAEVPVHFTRFHPSYRLANLPSTPVATLERARAAALDEGLRFVYLGNVPGHPAENTLCPGCQKPLIRRLGMAVIENRLRDGACPDCRRKIPGVWS